jgi:CPA1 family monovalent cation:H+ antiporter
MIEITMTFLSAYGAFIIAQLLGLSGVIACVIAGMIAGSWGARGMRPSTRAAADSYWNYTAFLLNSVVFLLIGTQIQLPTLTHYLPEILIGWVAINISRAAVVYTKFAIMRLAGSTDFPLTWATIIGWGGLRGGLSMVLALALPHTFKHREMILHTTYGVVLLTLLVQGLTIKPLLRGLRLRGTHEATRRPDAGVKPALRETSDQGAGCGGGRVIARVASIHPNANTATRPCRIGSDPAF